MAKASEAKQSETEPALTEQQADKTAEARQKQREANDAAFKASIEGQEMPPSYAEAERQEAEQAAQAKEEQDAALADLAATTERIASSGMSTPASSDVEPSGAQLGQSQS